MVRRRDFIGGVAAGAASLSLGQNSPLALAAEKPAALHISKPMVGEDVLAYIQRKSGRFDSNVYKQILGAANEFKEGDEIVGIAAADTASRNHARELLANSLLNDIDAYEIHEDELSKLLRNSLRQKAVAQMTKLTLGKLKQFLLTQDEAAIKSVMPSLSSDVIGCVVKLMSNQELIAVGAKVFNSLPGSKIGSKGYLGARIQPNSPTDNVDDIRWQVFDAWSYAVGDVLLGTNPVSSDPKSVAAVERTLKDLLVTFGIDEVMPHCVLSHIDVQAEVEKQEPGSTALWFQSIAGCDSANTTFDVTIKKMMDYARRKTGQYGLYFETGQGADFTNGHGHGFDMVLHESRKYGFARSLTHEVENTLKKSGSKYQPWIHLNDVAGFIGPEVFRTREQLVRCCLEDIVMGKLHGLCIGLDICSTLHMDVSLDDLDWCIDQIMPANPAYLMALPTKIDPMLGYLTTGYQDHVRIRDKFGYKVNDRMWQFYQHLQVIDKDGKPTKHFGDPLWIYLQYRRKKRDRRETNTIVAEGKKQLEEVRARGVFVARGHGKRPWDLTPKLATDIKRIYDDAKKSIWTELKPAFIDNVPDVLQLSTRSADRNDYILHPDSGEQLSEDSVQVLRRLNKQHAGKHNVQVVVSDGLNALAIMDDGHLAPYLARLRDGLKQDGYSTAAENVLLTSGRVRAGYRIGETLFGGLIDNRVLLHVIGERPGTGHHTFSIYITAANGEVWGQAGKVDHNITKVVSGAAITALVPKKAADETLRILKTLV
ncbi:MAG: ethanolamine ammonia-lyase large subunit [Pirellulaceae bacterium]|jgi:ethanolamine ammonia-lyase large subunit